MRSSIHILPPALANQIAAGEVVQRPANAVKELLENALDAGATKIELILRAAGKDAIQIIDNGGGIPPDEIPLAFQRHATSKIQQTEDLFAIRSMGFRGEALASIAAISKISIVSRTADEELGTQVQLDAGEIVESIPVAAHPGTSIAVRNLFYNVPARRKFLKSDRVELKHIYEAFHRVALAYPDIHFELVSDGQKVFHLEPQSSRQRIAQIMGKVYHERLVPVAEQTDPVEVSGFIVKPEHARKSRGEQYLFVNGRFVKHYAIDRAIQRVFQAIIPEGNHPGYFLFLKVDPAFVDVNIHPTKTEIKFEDEHTASAIVASAVKKSLGQHNLSSGLNFDLDPELDAIQHAPPPNVIRPPRIEVDENYNPFRSTESSGPGSRSPYSGTSGTDQWQQLYEPRPEVPTPDLEGRGVGEEFQGMEGPWAAEIYGKYIVTKLASGVVFIHHQRAVEHLRFTEMLRKLSSGAASSQGLLFPEPIYLSVRASEWLLEHASRLRERGFQLDPTEEAQQWNLVAVPGTIDASWNDFISEMIDLWMDSDEDLWNQTAAAKYAQSIRIQSDAPRSQGVLIDLVGQLFALPEPTFTWDGRRILITLSSTELDQKFKS